MPWSPGSTRRATPERNPQIADMWAVLRSIESRIGGLTAEVAVVALSVTRADARNENTMAEVRDIAARLDKIAHTITGALQQSGYDGA